MLSPAQIKPKLFESRQNLFSFLFLPGADALHSMCVLTLRCFHSQKSSYYPNLWEGADSVGGQMRGDQECPFSGVLTRHFLQSGGRLPETKAWSGRYRIILQTALRQQPEEFPNS